MAGPLNLPNQITLARLAVAVAMFVTLSHQHYGWSLLLFIFAAATDWIDGYLARKRGQVTQLGRVLDPFADKLVVCGAFILLIAVPGARIAPWMAVVVVGRELLVTTLRSLIEASGGDFSANWAGKWKMVVQCAAIIACLVRLVFFFDVSTGVWTATPGWLDATTTVLVWAAVILTIYSGVDYIRIAARMVRQ